MVLRLLANTLIHLWVKKLNLFIFSHAPSKTLPQVFIITSKAEGNYPFLPNSVFWRSIFPQAEIGRTGSGGIRELKKLVKLNLPQQTFAGLEDVLKTSPRHVFKTSSTRCQRNNFTSSKTSWRRLEDLSWRRLEDMSWRCLEDMSWRRLEDMETSKILTGEICI